MSRVTGLSNMLDNIVRYLRNINSRIDQTMLKYDKGLKDYENFVETSDSYGFRSLVVPSCMVGYVASIAKTPVAGVAGFPFGYYPLELKKKEIELIASSGGKEVDVVINLIYVKSSNFNAVSNEIKELVNEAKQYSLLIKVIVETSVLTEDELSKIAKIVLESGADFIKTNSGYGPRGANLRDIYVIKSSVGDRLRIKASGGIRTAIDAATFIAAGAEVIGASSGIKIVEEAKRVLSK